MVSGGDRGGISRRKQSLKGGWGGGELPKESLRTTLFADFVPFFSFSNLLKTQLKNKEAILFHSKR